jgi:cyd operon protein YbgT
MWYFSWILGLGLACSFAILNAMWFELRADAQAAAPADPGVDPHDPPR